MKKLKLIVSIIYIILAVNTVEAQLQNINTKKGVEIKNSSKETYISFEVHKNRKMLMLNVTCNVSFGSIGIEIYDPSGKKKGSFLVRNDIKKGKTSKKLFSDVVKEAITSTKINHSTKNANGMMDKVFHFPLKGIWKIKILPKKATGHVSISANQ